MYKSAPGICTNMAGRCQKTPRCSRILVLTGRFISLNLVFVQIWLSSVGKHPDLYGFAFPLADVQIRSWYLHKYGWAVSENTQMFTDFGFDWQIYKSEPGICANMAEQCWKTPRSLRICISTCRCTNPLLVFAQIWLGGVRKHPDVHGFWF